MSVSASDVRRIAHLARLGIDEEQISGYAAELSRILDFVRQLEGADTKGVAPMAHPLDTRLRLREDRVTEADQREEFLPLAPESTSGLYLVPRVIE